MRKIIELLTSPNDIVLDFFTGSGATLSSAFQLNRQFIGIELMEENVDLIKHRLQNLMIMFPKNKNFSFTTSI